MNCENPEQPHCLYDNNDGLIFIFEFLFCFKQGWKAYGEATRPAIKGRMKGESEVVLRERHHSGLRVNKNHQKGSVHTCTFICTTLAMDEAAQSIRQGYTHKNIKNESVRSPQ